MNLFCLNQAEDSKGVFCMEKAAQGYSGCNCPYTAEDLTLIEGRLIPQRNPRPNADGVCRDFQPIEDLSVIVSENYIG